VNDADVQAITGSSRYLGLFTSVYLTGILITWRSCARKERLKWMFLQSPQAGEKLEAEVFL
jgi:hypothetical protein